VRWDHPALVTRAREAGLDIFGGFHPAADELAGAQTLLLLGPHEPGFWAWLTAAPEWQDGAPDPVDRWSARVVATLAADTGGAALFPFTGPPWHPFYAWALRTGRAWPSPVRLLVHDLAGLWVSFRGALALPYPVDLPAPAGNPCTTCPAPCLTACPAGALTGDGYDVSACHAYLDTSAGMDCISRGCAVRRACPVGQAYGRVEEQSAYHMRRFHP
jgi:hypothetical protein